MCEKSEQICKHTPGPWIFYADVPSTDPDWHIVTTENRLRVIANVHIEPGNEMDAANARLIASAPDLLEALKLYMASGELMNAAMKDGGNVHGALSALVGAEDMANWAIAKAEGRS